MERETNSPSGPLGGREQGVGRAAKEQWGEEGTKRGGKEAIEVVPGLMEPQKLATPYSFRKEEGRLKLWVK